ncbi:MAG: hypothetical protein QOG49_840, partial [Frankiaceae bacterium]|nr:hypothetical protein [Frankiaceae bacterium]
MDAVPHDPTGTPLRDLPLRDYTPRQQLRAAASSVPRPALRAVDAHNHLGRWLTADGSWMVDDVPRLVAEMDECDIAAVVNLDGRMFELEDNLDRYDRRYPGRFATFCQLDWSALAHADDVAGLVADLARAADLGARGLKVWKTL